MTVQNDFINLVLECFKKEVIKKLVFSRPDGTDAQKATGRLCAHRGRRVLALEFALPGNTVSQKNVKEDDLEGELVSLLSVYKQANLITTVGDAERKVSKGGKEVLLGKDRLLNKLRGNSTAFEKAIASLDNKKNYILSGGEDFLKALEISDKSGRVHDKKQGKFRQINRFLEHIENICGTLPQERKILIYDLCSGKSYLSFAVYHYFTAVKHREVDMLCIDLKRDVIAWCESVSSTLGYTGMRFVCDDIANTPSDTSPDMVISLHACDIATDIVINRAISLGAGVILSTPCCHQYMNDKVQAKELSFVTEYPHLKNKLCEALTDSVRLARLRANGYKVRALELTDPENTPKNTLLHAVKEENLNEAELDMRKKEYENILTFILGDGKDNYLKEITKG